MTEDTCWGDTYRRLIAKGHDKASAAMEADKRWQDPDDIPLYPADHRAPGHTDLMVTPESIDAFMEANPLPPRATRLKAVAPHWAQRVGDQCERALDDMAYTTAHSRGWRQKRYERMGLDPQRCARGATILIQGQRLCSVHAGALALKIILGEVP